MFIANTQQQPLAQHSFAVGYLARVFIATLTEDKPNLQTAAYHAGCLHDLGKIDVQFQNWVTHNNDSDTEDGQHISQGEFSFETYPRHNEISLLLYRLLQPEQANHRLIEHAIYWHHAKPLRDEDYQNLGDIYKPIVKQIGKEGFADYLTHSQQLLTDINDLARAYGTDTLPPFTNKARLDLDEETLPNYKTYNAQNEFSDYLDNARKNANNALIRAVVITADRLISELSPDQLTQHLNAHSLEQLASERLTLNNDLNSAIQTVLHGFEQRYPNSERNRKQRETAEQLANISQIFIPQNDTPTPLAVLQGAAGCGKTKIALEWALNTHAQKIIWICPRVAVCEGIYDDLTHADYLINHQIEIHTGEFKTIKQHGNDPIDTDKNTFFSGDIVITTIDQILNSILTHRHITTLMDYMNAHIVFDEFHEYIHTEGFNLLFAELLECKKTRANRANTLLVSATPNHLFLNEFLGADNFKLVRMDTFNNKPYHLNIHHYDKNSTPFYAPQAPNSFVISNTATTAQRSYLDNEARENALLIHSKFTKTDKEQIFKKLIHSFGEHGTPEYDLVRSGPIIQAALNINCQQMLTEITHAENTLQRLGRLDRFAQNQNPNHYTIAVSEKFPEDSAGKFLNQQHSKNSAVAWYNYLKNQLQTTDTVTLSTVYDWYEQFYQQPEAQQKIRDDLHQSLKASVKLIKAKVLDPIRPANRKPTKNDIIRIKKDSLRGDNRFVQLAVCQIQNGALLPTENYAYTDYKDALTTSIQDITAYGDSRKSPLVFMAKKHHNIKTDAKKSRNDAALLNQARSPEYPIYLSYTPNDLAKVNEQNQNYAFYYIKGQKQAVGIMKAEQLKKLITQDTE
ncbi:hypothetical protein BAC3_01056 [uncultured bacterium]|nr:hypothetical protein BAC3_01056 [uncultured bacterium]